MKKYSIIALGFILTSALFLPHAQAQEGKFGIKGGLNLSSLTLDDKNDKNLLPTFHAGIWFKAPLSEKFAIQPEILYSVKGTKVEYTKEFLGFDVVDGKTTLKLNYIDIPIYLVYNLSEDFNFHIGPYVGFLVNTKFDSQNEVLGFIDIDNNDDLDRDHFNAIDAGLSAGLGFNMNNFIFGFNYNLGLTQVAKPDDASEKLIKDARNSVIQVYIGFAF